MSTIDKVKVAFLFLLSGLLYFYFWLLMERTHWLMAKPANLGTDVIVGLFCLTAFAIFIGLKIRPRGLYRAIGVMLPLSYLILISILVFTGGVIDKTWF